MFGGAEYFLSILIELRTVYILKQSLVGIVQHFIGLTIQVSKMILLQILAEIKSDKRREFEQAVGMMLKWQQQTEGCLSVNLSQRLDKQNIYNYMEEWQDRKALDQHMVSDDFRALLGAMKVLGEIRDARIITSEEIEPLKMN